MKEFKKYLKRENSKNKNRNIALTASSYKNFNHSIENKQTNVELATYGDALLKLAFCEILFAEGVDNITVQKQNYESDEILVKIIGREYELLNYIKYDEKDSKIPKNYDYEKPARKGKDSPHKFIATAIEALIAAFYLDNDKNFDLVVDVAKEWKGIIDKKVKNFS